MSIKKNGVIASSTCDCPRGLDVCHHMAALLLNAHYNVGATDKPRTWGTTKALDVDDIKPVDELFSNKTTYTAVDDLGLLNIKGFRETLGDTNIVGFSWLLKPEASNDLQKLIPSIEDIVFSKDYLEATDKSGYLQSQCYLTDEKIVEIANATVGQHKNELWLITRKMRLTASKFGSALDACERNMRQGRKFPPSLFRSLLEGYNLERVKSVNWGKTNEETAKERFSEIHNLPVTSTGLWLDNSGFLGASPDGLVGDDAVLEIKCPYKMRECGIREGVKDGKYFFHYNEDDDAVVKCEHPYYHQLQAQMYLTNRTRGYFFIWTPIECQTLILERDEEWYNNLDVLRDFYLNIFIKNVFN